MEQSCQTAFAEDMYGTAGSDSDAEILAAVRRVLTAEEISHPDVVEPPRKTSLVSTLLNRLRG
ncbi:hypothetical protein PhaeoP72_02208 [Phaeobacter inhibens]|uniref:Uncharacterized protein n=1 Tax=Phaeobacter inhibens TaxID=221822 RepID=A0A2I7KNJ9_9RHOB|nr:hypothetical protein [Phaeobacter inhibens]AUQ70957.1 hypothetical protein PhaeoP54_02077 [Phaeobacter inhibens]AUQ99582.1 hypothetical protein PhaeoP88_02221 [Phaeobacter inhibens]AUR04170.1 hypothetical protein PhaeoP72_02208 [Phaeobacter inhibens]AXT42817.1 hypothetical protein D1821_10655 [Phaeobacter inhibens]UWR79013.1 hypothetical protein K4K97_10275 [Phaeobacter inhibens]